MAKVSLTTWINRLGKCKLEEEDLLAKLKTVRKKKEDITNKILDHCDKEDIGSIKNKSWRVSLTRAVVPNVTDWDKFYKYIARNKAYHMLQRRVSVSAYREKLEDKKTIPGVESFTKIGLRLSKVK